MNTYSLTIKSSDSEGIAIPGVKLSLEGENYSNSSTIEGPDGVVFFRLKSGIYKCRATYGSSIQNLEINLMQDEIKTIIFQSQAKAKNQSVPRSFSNTSNESNATSPSLSWKWFVSLMDQVDGLIKNQKANAPKMHIVFVPIGYSKNESEEFKAVARSAVARFESVSPLKECKDPSNEIEADFIEPDVCNITGCSDICGQFFDASENCQILVSKCSAESISKFDLTIGLCRNNSCQGACGCSAGIPSTSTVLNVADCGGASVEKIMTHEVGHALGLYHIKSMENYSGCWDHEEGACTGPNIADCKRTDEEISKDIMAYCPAMENFGPAAYVFLNNSPLQKYTEVCR
jgi:hypothetical protein